jgi:hypothetical protein
MQLLNTLYVTTPETYLHLENDTIRIEVERTTRLRVPLHHVGTVVCFGNVLLSTPLMHRLADDGIGLVLLDGNGRFKARLEGPFRAMFCYAKPSTTAVRMLSAALPSPVHVSPARSRTPDKCCCGAGGRRKSRMTRPT